MAVNNYIRIGYHPDITILTFDDKDPAEIERIKIRVMELAGFRSHVNIGLWRRCLGLPYPIVGESQRGTA